MTAPIMYNDYMEITGLLPRVLKVLITPILQQMMDILQ